MFDLLDNGAIAIDFEVPDPEHPETVTASRVTVSPPPTFGAYKRVRSEVEKLNKGRDENTKTWQADDTIGVAEFQQRLAAYTEDSAISWWLFVMNGDDSYKGQADFAPPADLDGWPIYMTSNDAITLALTHWKTVPLARGGKPVQVTR